MTDMNTDWSKYLYELLFLLDRVDDYRDRHQSILIRD